MTLPFNLTVSECIFILTTIGAAIGWYLSRKKRSAETRVTEATADQVEHKIMMDRIAFMKEERDNYKILWQEGQIENKALKLHITSQEERCSEEIEALKKRCNDLEEVVAKLSIKAGLS